MAVNNEADGEIRPEVREHHHNEIGNRREYCSSNYLLAVIILPVLVALLYYQLYAPIKQLNESIQQLNTFINMLDQQLSQQNDSVYQQLNEKVQWLNTSINMLDQQLSQQNDSVYQQLNEKVQWLNTSINVFNQQLSQQNDSVYQQLNEKVQQLNTSINVFNQQLSQQNDSVYQQLNEKVRQLNTSFNQQLSQQNDSVYQQLQLNEVVQQLNTSINVLNSLVEEVHQLNSSTNIKLSQQYAVINSLYQQLRQLDNRTLQLNASLLSPGHFPFNLLDSCAALPPSSPSGYYWVRASNGSALSVYCDMIKSCGGVTGGWMRVAELDMTNSSHQCPSGLMERIYSGKRTCVRIETAGGCSSANNFITPGVEYSHVCGRVIGYQYGSTDAFIGGTSADSRYVDGVSLTHGHPRRHIWTFAAAQDEVGSFNCPCTNTNQAIPSPIFVGNDYFCDTGSEERHQKIFYGDDPLWDGAGCGPLNTCCSFNTPPWFYKQLPHSTTDDIEMRVCTDSNSDDTNENVAIEIIDVYVQ